MVSRITLFKLWCWCFMINYDNNNNKWSDFQYNHCKKSYICSTCYLPQILTHDFIIISHSFGFPFYPLCGYNSDMFVRSIHFVPFALFFLVLVVVPQLRRVSLTLLRVRERYIIYRKNVCWLWQADICIRYSESYWRWSIL